jgi:hypothetical protein
MVIEHGRTSVRVEQQKASPGRMTAVLRAVAPTGPRALLAFGLMSSLAACAGAQAPATSAPPAPKTDPPPASIAATSFMLRDIVNSDLRVGWALVTGPSMDGMDKDVAVLRCDADDGTIDAWLDAYSARTRGTGPLPLSLPDTYAVTGNLEGPHVAMRLPHHLLALVPPEMADDAAHAITSALVPDRVDLREALRMREKRAPRQGFPEFVSPEVSELRVWFEPGPGPSCDAFVEEDAATPAAATKAADTMRAWVHRQAGTSQMMGTGGLFDHVDVATRGRMATAHVHASPEQVTATLGLLVKLSGASRP